MINYYVPKLGSYLNHCAKYVDYSLVRCVPVNFIVRCRVAGRMLPVVLNFSCLLMCFNGTAMVMVMILILDLWRLVFNLIPGPNYKLDGG